MTPSLPSPSALLGDPQWPGWFPGQEKALLSVLDWLSNSSSRFLCASLPTGAGKTLIAVLSSHLSGQRAVALTSTKGLQSQYMRDFARHGMMDIRGQNSYQCLYDKTVDLTCDNGPCHAGFQCSHKATDCYYYSALGKAAYSKKVVTNYAYWLAQHAYSDGIGDTDLLILDECHLAFQALESFAAVHVTTEEVGALGLRPEAYETWPDWRQWAVRCLPKVIRARDILKKDIDELREEEEESPPMAMIREWRRMVNLARRFEAITTSPTERVWEHYGGRWTFTPVWPAAYSSSLFREVPKILLMSACLTPKTASFLGVEDPTWLEMPSYFPPQNTPVMHVPTVRVNHRTTEAEMRQWVARIDQIIDRRLDRKGIIFTVSYSRRNFLVTNSRHANIMVSHDTRTVTEAVARFRASPAPSVLVSPSVTSGWDFSGDDCEYIIAGKIPYPDSSHPVIKRRNEEDNEWSSFAAMETIVQEAGRGSRSVEDKCEVLIVDDNWRWFWKRYQHFAPTWFSDRVRGSVNTVPDPPR